MFILQVYKMNKWCLRNTNVPDDDQFQRWPWPHGQIP